MDDGSSAVNIEEEPPIECRPFVKWAGGKRQLISELRARLPWNYKKYFEPFIGGGALLFSLQPTSGCIWDISEELINVFNVVKNELEPLIKELKQHVYEKDYYYRIRAVDRSDDYKSWSSVQRAARFIYLNKSCYNGLYRVSSKGYFNVPFGKYTNPTILDEDNLRACNTVLQPIDIRVGGFEEVEEIATSEDLVYFDPPYVPLNETSNFTAYTAGGFDSGMQQKLFELCCRLDERKVKFMLSNSSSQIVKDLYAKFRVETVYAQRAVNSKASKRGPIAEVIIRNY